uniref:GNAT family N-acetyltransferase n=1 Tax=Caballeronia sp. LjRoot34 TaxID=3342325 RepID=UPI003F508E19
MQDEPFLVQLRKLTMARYLCRWGYPSDDRAHYRRIRFRFEDAKIIFLDAERIGVLKATCEGPHWFIHQLQILPRFQRKGIGTAVLTSLLLEAREEAGRVSLDVLRDNPARRLYQRLGLYVESSTDLELRMTVSFAISKQISFEQRAADV